MRRCNARRSSDTRFSRDSSRPASSRSSLRLHVHQGGDLIGSEHGVELGGEVRRLGVGSDQHGQVLRTGRAAGTGGEDAGQVVDQGGQVGRAVRALVVEIGVDDVQPALDQPPEVGEGHLGLLALGAHGPDVVQRPGVDAVEVGAGQNTVEVIPEAWHHARSYSPGQGAGPLRPGGAYR